jgi:hypothetical protein
MGELADCGCYCSVCHRGFHIFCNVRPHGTEEEAERWFLENPEAARQVRPLGERALEVHERALKRIDEGDVVTDQPEDIFAVQLRVAAQVAERRCSCKHGCMTKEEMQGRHGTPAEFEVAVHRAADHLMITMAEAESAIEKYRREWANCGEILLQAGGQLPYDRPR